MNFRTKLIGASTEANKMLAKEFNNLEDKIIIVQKNQVEFEKYLLKILEKLDEIEKIKTQN